MSSKVCVKDSLVEQLVKNPPAMQEIAVQLLGQEDPLERGQATHSSILQLPSGSAGKESACSASDLGSVPGLARSPGDENSYPLQYSGLENSMYCIVHGVAKNGLATFILGYKNDSCIITTVYSTVAKKKKQNTLNALKRIILLLYTYAILSGNISYIFLQSMYNTFIQFG